jgi:E3 ubiquitin-protein ligase MARCH6
MEWLQHSQKKYCELCKTPFTFTKIYDPDMPKTLPTPLFLRQSIRRLGRDLLFYARALLVGIVWLCCLPWMVRSMWLSWFWISDGGWWRDPPGPTNVLNPSTPTSELPAEATSSANGRGILGYLSSPSLSAVMSPVNGAAIVNTTIESVHNATNPDMVVRDGIFFSHNPFYQATRFPAINRTMLHILDGQILTAFIVFSFIVVFLIREWVVQQQPAILGDAANIPLLNEQPFPPAAPAPEPINDGDDEDDVPRPANVALPNDFAVLEAFINRERNRRNNDNNDAAQDEAGNAELPRERVIARPRRRRPVVIDAEDENIAAQDTMDGAADQPAPQEETVDRGTSTAFNFAEVLPRPTPTRETTSHVANLRRELEESGRSAGSNSVYDFSGAGSSTDNIFQFGGGNPPPTRPPATEALFASPPWMDNAPWDQELPEDEDSASRLDTIDTGRTTDWMEANTGSQSGSNTTERAMSFTGLGYDPSRLSAIAAGQDDSTTDDDHSTESSTGSFQMIGKPNDKGKEKDTSIPEESSSGSSGKGKNKEVTHDTEETLFNFDDLNDIREQANDSDDDSTTEGSRGYRRLTTATSDWSAAATAGDTPDPSSSSGTPPPPPPRRADSLNYYERRPIMNEPPPPRVNENEQQQRIHEIRNRLLRGDMPGDIPNFLREMREENQMRPNEEMVRAIVGAVPDRNDAAGQRRAGFLDWIMEDQQAPMDMDEDTDDEEPPVAPPVLVNDDAADDFEGIMELVGMRGPLMGLVQNAAISSLLITATVAVGVAFPYVTGKTVMVILAHPIVFFIRFPLKIVSFSAEFLVDFSTMVIFHTLLLAGHVLGLLATPFSWMIPDMSAFSWTVMLTNFLKSWANDGQSRVLRKWVSFETSYIAMKRYTPASTPPLRLVLKEALNRLSGSIMWGLEKIGLDSLAKARMTVGPAELDLKVLTVTNPVAWTVNALEETFAAVNFTKTANATIDHATLDLVRRLDPSVTYKWNFWDRLGVVFLGYAAFTVIGMVYVTRRRHDQQNSVERVVIEFLKQCGGVMKVVLIIGIEMFLFPLYCGLLLGKFIPSQLLTHS